MYIQRGMNSKSITRTIYIYIRDIALLYYTYYRCTHSRSLIRARSMITRLKQNNIIIQKYLMYLHNIIIISFLTSFIDIKVPNILSRIKRRYSTQNAVRRLLNNINKKQKIK